MLIIAIIALEQGEVFNTVHIHDFKAVIYCLEGIHILSKLYDYLKRPKYIYSLPYRLCSDPVESAITVTLSAETRSESPDKSSRPITLYPPRYHLSSNGGGILGVGFAPSELIIRNFRRSSETLSPQRHICCKVSFVFLCKVLSLACLRVCWLASPSMDIFTSLGASIF